MAVVMAGASFCLPLPVRASGALFLASSPTVAVSFGAFTSCPQCPMTFTFLFKAFVNRA